MSGTCNDCGRGIHLGTCLTAALARVAELETEREALLQVEQASRRRWIVWMRATYDEDLEKALARLDVMRAATPSVSPSQEEKTDEAVPVLRTTAMPAGASDVQAMQQQSSEVPPDEGRRDGALRDDLGGRAGPSIREATSAMNALRPSDPKAEYLFPVEVVVRCVVQAPAGYCPDFDQRAYEAVRRAPREAVQVVAVWGTNVRPAQRLNDAKTDETIVLSRKTDGTPLLARVEYGSVDGREKGGEL